MLPFDFKALTIDVESRNLNLSPRIGDFNSNKVWQVSFIETSGTRILNEFDFYVDVPNLDLSDQVKVLTNFDQFKYNKLKKPAEEVWPIVKKYLYDEQYIIIGQNIMGFDQYCCDILAHQAGDKIDYSKFIERIYDTRAFGLAYKNTIDKPRNCYNLYLWQHKILNDRSLKGKVSQTALLKDLGLQSVNEASRHDALTDVKDTFNIFTELKKRMQL
jgi:hypothetical protein